MATRAPIAFQLMVPGYTAIQMVVHGNLAPTLLYKEKNLHV